MKSTIDIQFNFRELILLNESIQTRINAIDKVLELLHEGKSVGIYNDEKIELQAMSDRIEDIIFPLK